MLSKKKNQIYFTLGKKTMGVSLKQQIEAYYPEVRLLYPDINIIFGSVSEKWEESTPMCLVNEKLNIWEADLELKGGFVKFKSRDSWMQNWGGDTFPNGNSIFYGDNIFVEPGKYHVILNLTENSYEFIKLED